MHACSPDHADDTNHTTPLQTEKDAQHLNDVHFFMPIGPSPSTGYDPIDREGRRIFGEGSKPTVPTFTPGQLFDQIITMQQQQQQQPRSSGGAAMATTRTMAMPPSSSRWTSRSSSTASTAI